MDENSGLDRAEAFLQETPEDAAQRTRTLEVEQLGNQIVDTLKTIYDPEIPVNIYDLGLVYTVEITPGILSKSLSVHQKQPPANTAVARCPPDAGAACEGSLPQAVSSANELTAMPARHVRRKTMNFVIGDPFDPVGGKIP